MIRAALLGGLAGLAGGMVATFIGCADGWHPYAITALSIAMLNLGRAL